MRHIVLFAAVTGLLSWASNAVACKNIRLDAPGMPLAKTAVLDQDGVDDCFASAASVLIDTWRFSHDPPMGDKNYNHLTFPLDLAIQQAAKHPGSTLHSGGSAAQVLRDLKEDGSCDPTHATSSSPSLSPELDEWLRSQVGDLQRCKEAAALYSDPGISSNQDSTSSSSDCPLKSGLNLKFPFLDPVERALGTESTLDALKRAMAHLCPKEKRQAVGGYSVTYHALKNPKELSTHLDSMFSKPAPIQPMTIGFCSNILNEGGEKYSGLTWNQDGPAAQGGCEKHEAVVIGEEIGEDGKCKTILQNSWGGSCNAYPKKWKCQGGKITVDEDVLAANALETTYLEGEVK